MSGADGSALPSARVMVTRLLVRLLVHRSSVTGLPLVRLLVCLFVHLSSVSRASLVHRSCIAGLPFVCRCSARVMGARPSDHPLLVRLIIRRSSVTDLSARPYLFVHRLCIARPPPRLSVRASLLHLSCIARPSACPSLIRY